MSDEQFELNEENYLDENEITRGYSKESFVEKIAARSRVIIVGLIVTVALTIGTVMYTSAQEAESAQYATQNVQYTA